MVQVILPGVGGASLVDIILSGGGSAWFRGDPAWKEGVGRGEGVDTLVQVMLWTGSVVGIFS